MVEEHVMDGEGGGRGGLAPLAGAAEDDAAGGVLEDFGLRAVGVEVKDVAGEGDGIEMVLQSAWFVH